MASVPTVTGKIRFERGPITYPAGVAIKGGQVVTFGTAGNAGKAIVATAGSVPLGVASMGALPAGTAQTGTSIAGYPMLEPMLPGPKVAVRRRGVMYLLAAGTIAPGQFVKAAAGGTVVAWVVGTDTDTTLRVGQCVAEAGGTNGNPVLIDVNIG